MMKKTYFIISLVLGLMTIIFTGCEDDRGSTGGTTLTLDMALITPPEDGFVYGVWLIEGGDYFYLGAFDIVDGVQTKTMFPVGRSRIDAAAGVLISLEPVTGAGSQPSDHRIAAGDFVNQGARLMAGHPEALGLDFEASSASYILATPTDNDSTNEASGVWFYDPDSMSSTLDLPDLGENWSYEGWIDMNDTLLSLGKFSDPSMADDLDRYSAGDNPGFNAPGGDLLQGLDILPRDLFDLSLFVSVEPIPDNDPVNPFCIQPLATFIADSIPTSPQTLDYQKFGIVRGLAIR